jgi:Tol biopolymer transport system component
MYDGTNTPGIGYDTTRSFGNNLFFSSDYTDGYKEDPGTYFIRAEVEYYVSNLATETRNVVLDPSSVTAFPNPFRDNAQVQYLLKRPGDVEIYVTDMQGRAVSNQTLKNQPSGQGTYRLNGADLSPGMYTVTLKIDGQVIQKKMVRH